MRSDYVPHFCLNKFTQDTKNACTTFIGPWLFEMPKALAFQPQVREDRLTISSLTSDMPLPKWSTMTDESQAMVKKTSVGLGIGILVVWFALGFVKAILPLVFLGGAGYVAWRVLSKQ